MASEKIVGLVIKKINYSEFDEINTIISNDEILTFISLGTRKLKSKNRMSLQLGNIVEVEIFRARLVGKVSKLKRSALVLQPPLQTSDTALTIMQIIKNINRLDKTNESVYRAIMATFKHFGEDYNHHIKTFITYSLLSPLGLQPHFGSCTICNRRDKIIEFDFNSGGYLCNLHAHDRDELKELEAYGPLRKSFVEYMKVDPDVNKRIYEKLISFLDRNIY